MTEIKQVVVLERKSLEILVLGGLTSTRGMGSTYQTAGTTFLLLGHNTGSPLRCIWPDVNRSSF